MSFSRLFDTRKQRLVRGLRQRLADHRGSLTTLGDRLAVERATMEQAYLQSSSEIAQLERNEHDAAVMAWDTRREEAYLRSDRATLAALRTEAKQLQELKEEHHRARQQEGASYQTAKKTLEQNYEELKPKPGKILQRYVEQLESRRVEAEEVIDQYRSVMLDRSVTIPMLQSAEVASDEPLPGSMQTSLDALQASVTEIRRMVDAVRRDPMVRLSGSIVPWLIGLIPGVVLGLLLWRFLGDQPWLAVGLTLATLALFPLALVFSLMPRVRRRMVGPYRELIKLLERMVAVSNHGRQLAESHCRNEQFRLLHEFKERSKKLDDQYRVTIEQLDSQLDQNQTALKNQQSELRRQAALQCHQSIELTDQQLAPGLQQLISQQGQRAEEHQGRFEADQQSMGARQAELLDRLQRRYRTGTAKAQAWLEQRQRLFSERFPDWNSDIWRDGEWPRRKEATIFPIGSCKLAIPPDFESRLVIDFDLLGKGALIVEADREHREEASGLVRSLLARAFTSLPMGSLQATMIDPEGLGKDFGWLMQLSDADPRLVGHRVWTQHSQIAEQLSLLAFQTEEIIQQRLRDRYTNLLDYNEDAGPMAEPLRLVVWSNFPFGLDEVAWKALCSLLASGARCGIGVVLTIDPNQTWPAFADRDKIFQSGLRLQLGASSRVVLPEFMDFKFELDPPPSIPALNAIMQHCTQSAMQAGKVEIPFATIGFDEANVGTGSTRDGLIVPLGVAGVGRTTSLRLGQGTAQHVLVAGKTGSGKSSLLHTLVTSAALKYAPDELRMVLLDFKKGVEFQVYAQQALPHADIIAIESRREFGLSALEYLDRVMQRRGEMFRQAGVQDVPSWRRTRPAEKMPRVLAVIDEFQEMFVEDDKLAQQSAMLLDRIVRQGRSFGVHMVLASQTLGGSYSLPRTTLAQMAVRIALQCDGADAMMILGEDNLAAARLRHSGQAIYNDAGGRVESNQPFQVAYLTAATHAEQLSRIPRADHPVDPSTNTLGRQIVFEGHKPAVWNDADVQRGIESLPKLERGALPIVLGESLSIDPTIVKTLHRQAGRNMGIIGGDEALAANAISSMIRGWLLAHRSFSMPRIYFLDGTRADDGQASRLRPWLSSPEFLANGIDSERWPVVADVRGVDAMIESLAGELGRRMEATDRWYESIVLIVADLARFRELKRVEDFSFGSSGDSEKPTTDASFANLLREGPGVGIHVVCWADSWGTLSRFIPRQGLRDLEVRALMQMSSNDSNQLIDVSAANKLEPHAMIYFDETDGKVIKFRPYVL